MTTREKNCAIASACGWKPCTCPDSDCGYMIPPGHDVYYRNAILVPRYHNDLNAIHNAENIAIRGHHDMEYREMLDHVMNEGYSAIIYATAEQRAEAFGLTLNLWEPTTT